MGLIMNGTDLQSIIRRMKMKPGPEETLFPDEHSFL